MLYGLDAYENKGKSDEASVNEIEKMADSFSFEEVEQVYNQLQAAPSDTSRLEILVGVRAVARERAKEGSE
jgi:hypothetical protein